MPSINSECVPLSPKKWLNTTGCPFPKASQLNVYPADGSSMCGVSGAYNNNAHLASHINSILGSAPKGAVL